jgi:phage FluMu gp28-like protein
MPAIQLYEYQKNWVLDRSRFKIGMFPRQTGKTFTTTLDIVDDCFKAATLGGKSRWVILSRGERQAKEAMDEGVKLHAKAYKLAFDSYDYDFAVGEASYRALEVSLPNGSKITALPANPDTARGFSANVFLDEFAFHADSRKIWQALFPVISAGKKLRITSTPNGKNNKFYDLMTGKNDQWSRHQIDIFEAVRQGLPRDPAELKEALGDDDAWLQEYMCEWLDEAGSWLSFDLINSCENEAAGYPDSYQGGKCFIGIDIGRWSDLWVAWVWEQIGDVLWCREVSCLKRASFAEQDQRLDELIRFYDVQRVAIDKTGIGEKPTEDAQRRYGYYRVEGVQFTSNSKQQLAILGKQGFEDRKVRIPLGDSVLRTDLHKLKKTTTALGNVRFDADRDSNGHADRTWAAFLGLYAATCSTMLLPDFGGIDRDEGVRSGWGNFEVF